MCGIVGILGKETANKADIVRKMSATIKHRGPDDDGFFDDDFVSLGMRRLSIIDLAGGHQPITSKDGNTLIFFNGEIYNYKEIRPELEKKGFTFKTDSDTEVILHLYEAYGKAGLSKLRGMFAFAIYDSVSHLVFLARDYFGIKPLYYWKRDNMIAAFGSEIKAILEHPGYTPAVNDTATFHYLRFQYNPLEETFFKDIFTLRPGYCMTIDLLSNTFQTEQYWRFEFITKTTEVTPQYIPRSHLGGDEERLAEKTREILRNSVAHHMIADVPVGSFLSGGIDSSIIATLMNEIIEKEKPGTKNKTFTIGFNELSEGSAAKETSDMIGTDHTEITISPQEYFDALPRLMWHFDEPVADPSAIALYFVAREARKKVTVVLSGEGADELFGGYNIYRAPIEAAKISWIPRSIIAFAAKIFPDIWGKNYLKRASSKLEDWYIGNASIFSKEEQEKIWRAPTISGSTQPEVGLRASSKLDFGLEQIPIIEKTYVQAEQEKISDSATMQLVDINTWLVGDILAKADKMTMANSLELRVPFLDIEVANFARTLSDDMKWKEGKTKYILRKAFEQIIPKNTATRRKLGFPTPLKTWLSKDTQESREVYMRIRNSTYLTTHLDMTLVEKLIAGQMSGTDNSRKIYLLYMLALWHNVFIEKKL